MKKLSFIFVAIWLLGCGKNIEEISYVGCAWNIPNDMELISDKPLTYSNVNQVIDNEKIGSIKSISFLDNGDNIQRQELNIIQGPQISLVKEERQNQLLLQEYEQINPYSNAASKIIVLSTHNQAVVLKNINEEYISKCIEQNLGSE